MPITGTQYVGAVFDVSWDAICGSGERIAANHGTLRWHISHKRQQGGQGKISRVWKHGADLSLIKPHSKPPRLVCKICHLSSCYISTFYAVNGYSTISSRSTRSAAMERDCQFQFFTTVLSTLPLHAAHPLKWDFNPQ